MSDAPTGQSQRPSARIKRLTSMSWVWLIPLSALCLVAYLAYSYWSSRGPLITVTFDTAEGLSAQQTPVKFKAVRLGIVDSVTLNEDRSKVIAKIRMDERAEPMLTEETRFWVVRPRISGDLSALTTGLKALVSGAYVAIDPGNKKGSGKPKKHFEGLAQPPNVRSDQPGTAYYLVSDSLGSLSTGSPVYYRDVNVGKVLGHELLRDGEGVQVRIFVEAPYDERIGKTTRFWKSSGLHLRTGAEGLEIEVESLRSLLGGSIAFQTPPNGRNAERALAESTFELYEDRPTAELTFYDENIPYVTYFNGSAQGLTIGSDVLMYGRKLGAVTEVALARDPRPGHEGEFSVRVAFVVQPGRALPESDFEAFRPRGVRALRDKHLEVGLQTSSFLTGQKILALQYVNEPQEIFEREGEALVIPGHSQGLGDLPSSMASIASQIESIPFESIGRNLDETLIAARQTVGSPELKRAIVSLDEVLKEARVLIEEARGGLKPALERLPRIAQQLESAVEQANVALGRQGYGPDSTVQRNMERMTDNIAEAARSIRLLADHLHRQPEDLIRGREGEKP